MSILFSVFENHHDDDTLIASFILEKDAKECAIYLNNFERKYTEYYIEESHLYENFNDYLIDVKSSKE